MDLDQVMRTTFACREWTGDPVGDETLHRILDRARFAPNGGNRQGWHVIVLRDRKLREQLVPLIMPAASVYLAQAQAGEAPWNTIVPSAVDESEVRGRTVQFPGVAEMVDAPVVLVITLDLALTASFDRYQDRIGVVSGASIYPFVWNILLAARDEGLGGVLTTHLADQEPGLRALLAIPDHHAFAAMVPLGHPVRQLTELRRKPVEEFTTVDRFDGRPFTV